MSLNSVNMTNSISLVKQYMNALIYVEYAIRPINNPEKMIFIEISIYEDICKSN